MTVQGIALPFDSAGGAPLQRGNETTWARLDRRAISQCSFPTRSSRSTSGRLPTAALPRFPRRLDPPPLDDGPHLSYAIQWFAFSIIALVFGVIMAVRPWGESPSSSSIVLVDGCRVFCRRAAVASAPRKARSRF